MIKELTNIIGNCVVYNTALGCPACDMEIHKFSKKKWDT
jgi:hypothetical protein